MRHLPTFLILFAASTVCYGQPNLVPNGSFEDGDPPWNYEVMVIAPPWDSFRTTAATNCILNGEAPARASLPPKRTTCVEQYAISL